MEVLLCLAKVCNKLGGILEVKKGQRKASEGQSAVRYINAPEVVEETVKTRQAGRAGASS